ncbi:MAG: tRNA epoxyqueuosine(34) reductase QueG [Chloroflexota bacterium]
MTLTQRVKEEARRLGFQLVGVTTPDPPPRFAVYEHWLSQGYHGGMGYLARERARSLRADPKRILPDCQSVIVLGACYPGLNLVPEIPKGALHGLVASYACSEDYHTVLPTRLHTLVEFIEQQVAHPFSYRYYTDTGAILERDFAQRAGLGWIGKNSNLINPRLGSYIFLAEILLGIELRPDEPHVEDRCGTCTRCIDACPTGCILPGRMIDARKCISYLTIEHRGPIPVCLRPMLGKWVFGCDVCQQVCPWNQRFAPRREDSLFQLSLDIAYPDLIEELSLTSQDFNRKFKLCPVQRTKHRGYLRNVAVALGNARDPRSTQPLALALRNSEPLVRRHAAWALNQMGGYAAYQALQKARETEKDPDVLEEIGLG